MNAGMPSSPNPEQSFRAIPDLVRAHAARDPGHPALVQDGRTLTYGALDARMDRVAAGLKRDGCEPQAVVAICASNSPDYAAVLLGVLRAGVAMAPLPSAATGESVAGMVADSGARLLFVDEGAALALAPYRARYSARHVTMAGPHGSLDGAWLAPAGAEPDAVAIQPEWACTIIYSSGTTGTPKGIVQSHAMRWGYLRRSASFGYDPGTVALIATPLYSNATLVSFLPTLAAGGTVVLMSKFDAREYLALAERHRATHTMLVPVQYQRVMAVEEFGRFDLSAFRVKFCTGAPFPAALKADIVRRWPGALVEIYGLTEGGGTCILVANEHPDKLHTVGRPAPGADIRVIDDDGVELPRGETGEVVGRSAVMMTGYHNRPQLTAETEWFDGEGRRFLRSGDIGRFDADGFLTLLDRKKDVIISGGFNVYPSDLEAVLVAHPGVAEAAVVGVPSDRWGETPVAYVVLAPGTDVTSGALLAWANDRLARTQRLAAVEVVEQLPRSAIGKVIKRALSPHRS